MPNSYFRFKQFTVHQDRCAMKVCTDACILGAWASGIPLPAGGRMLDIGSGTGLLMLMLAQRHPGEIRGIEIEPGAFLQGKENMERSPWKERLPISLGDVRGFEFTGPFDFIVSNPPFYKGDLTAATVSQNIAKHSKELDLYALLEAIEVNLEKEGSFAILLPYHRIEYFKTLAAARCFYPRSECLVRQTPDHDFFRGLLHFSRKMDKASITELTIRNEQGQYSDAFVALMKDYYLYL
jgi:tRNA1Val (adenine37-N6)-methyltransferase